MPANVHNRNDLLCVDCRGQRQCDVTVYSVKLIESMLLTIDPVTSLPNVRHFEVIIVTNIIIIHCVFSSLSPLELGGLSTYQQTARHNSFHGTCDICSNSPYQELLAFLTIRSKCIIFVSHNTNTKPI